MKGRNYQQKRKPKNKQDFSTKDYFDAYTLDAKHQLTQDSPIKKNEIPLQLSSDNSNSRYLSSTVLKSDRLSVNKQPQQTSTKHTLDQVDGIFYSVIDDVVHKIDYLKTEFKNSPQNFNNQEFNLKQFYKEKYQRDQRRLNPKNRLSKDITNDINNGKSFDSNDDEDETKPIVIPMKEYLDGFCKEHNVKIKLNKFPMHIFLNQAQNGAFVEYKKGKIFKQIEKTKQLIKERERKEMSQKVAMGVKMRLSSNNFQSKWHKKFFERRVTLRKSISPARYKQPITSEQFNIIQGSKLLNYTSPQSIESTPRHSGFLSSQKKMSPHKKINQLSTTLNSFSLQKVSLQSTQHATMNNDNDKNMDSKQQNKAIFKNHKGNTSSMQEIKKEHQKNSPSKNTLQTLTNRSKFGTKRQSLPEILTSSQKDMSKEMSKHYLNQDLETFRRFDDSVNNSMTMTKAFNSNESLFQSADETIIKKPKISFLQKRIKNDESTESLSRSQNDKTENSYLNYALRKKELDKVIKMCYKEHQRSENEIKEIDYEVLIHNLQQNQFAHTVETLKELEYANPQVIPLLYKYKEKIKEEMDEEENEVSKEYRSGRMDPSSEVAKFEKVRRIRKMVGKKRDMELRFKALKEQKSIITGINYLSLA